jgi:hypothetical protein
MQLNRLVNSASVRQVPAEGKSKKVYSATLPMLLQQQNALIAKGVAPKLGDGKPYQIKLRWIAMRRCEATMPMADLPPTAPPLSKSTGSDVAFNIPSIKGIDKAIAAVG